LHSYILALRELCRKGFHFFEIAEYRTGVVRPAAALAAESRGVLLDKVSALRIA
jgi:hypothetical protein